MQVLPTWFVAIAYDRVSVVINSPFKEISLEQSLFSSLANLIARLQNTDGEIKGLQQA